MNEHHPQGPGMANPRVAYPKAAKAESPQAIAAGRTDQTLAALSELRDFLESAKAVPLSSNCMVNRQDVIERVDAIARLMPEEVQRAVHLVDQAQDIIGSVRRRGQEEINQAQTMAEQTIAQAHERAAQLVQREPILAQARAEADRVMQQAEADAQRMRQDVLEFCQRQVATLEDHLAALSRGAAQVRDGLGRLHTGASVINIATQRPAGEYPPAPGDTRAPDAYQPAGHHS